MITTVAIARARGRALAFATSGTRFRQGARLCIQAESRGLIWGLLPRRHRRALARELHRSRTLATSWPEQWAVTREAGRASIPA